MAKDLLEGQSKFWEDDEPSAEGRDLFAEAPQEAPLLDRLGSGAKKAFAGVGNTADIGGTLAWQGLARLGGKRPNPEVFKAMEERIRQRNELVKDDIDPGFLGKLFGLGVTLPAQMLNMPMAHAETGKTFIDEGESLGRAQAAMGVDAAGNAAGMLLPGWKAGSKAVRALTGAGANAGQDTATRLILQQLAEKEKTKDLFAPSAETAALSAIPGAAFAVALGKNKPKALPKPRADANQVVGEFANKPAEEGPYQKTKPEAAADEATIARLEAAIAKQNPQQPLMRVGKDGEAFSATPENIYARDQAEQRQIDLLDEHVHGRFPESIQEDIPFYSTVEEIAARQADPLQSDMFVGNTLPPQRPWRAEQAQASLEARQRALEQQVAEQAQLDAAQRQRQAGMADIERRRQEALQGPGAQQARNIHPSATGWNDLQVQRAGEEAAQTHEFLARNQHQGEFDTTPYGDPGAQFGSTMEHGRVDENGIPIRADLSMDAQNVQNPLQRNLWGDELPGRTGDNGLPITRALDKMPPGPERDAAVAQLTGQPPNPARLTDDVTSTLNRPVGLRKTSRFGQQGAIDPEVFREGFKAATRALSRLTDMPWVRAAFPASQYETNMDGSPKIMLHGTKANIHGDQLIPNREGFHAGYTSSPHMFAGQALKDKHGRRLDHTHKTTVNRIDYTNPDFPDGTHGQLYPIVIRKGNNPTLTFDMGSWDPIRMLQDIHSDWAGPRELIKAIVDNSTNRVTFSEVKDALKSFKDDYKTAVVTWGKDEVNKRWSDLLKTQFGIDGFFYKNDAESVKTFLQSRDANRDLYGAPGNKASNRRGPYEHPTSYVTWNKDKYHSIYKDLTEPRPIEAQGKFGQGGNVNPEMNDILTLGIPKLFGAIKNKFTGEVPPKVDTPLAPVSPEAIAKKQALAAKSAALGIGENLYAPINTLEEVKAMDGRDIGFDVAGKRRTPGQQLGSGMEGALRRNTSNPVLQWLSNMRTKAEANTNAALRKFITGEEGINRPFRKLSDQDKADVYDLALAMNDHRVKYTPELGTKYGLSPEADAFMQARQRMYDGEYQLGATVDSLLGIKHFEEHPGVARATFNSAYKAIVGVWEGEGKARKFVPKTVLNANNVWEFRQAKKWWAEEAQRRGLSNYEVKELPRQGLKTNTSPLRTFDGLAAVFSKLAELNPDFAEAKLAVDELIKGNTKKMGRYDYHALKKMGVEGAVGRKPWKQAADNIDDFFKAEINSFDEGFRYWNYQDVVNKMAQAQADPVIQQKYPNTVDYIQKSKDNLNGQGINQFGALTNAVLDKAFAATGFGNAMAPRKVMSDLRKSMSLLMMGVSNMGFVGIQMGQYWSAGIPEAMRLARDFDQGFAASAGKSFSHMLFYRPWLEWHAKMGTLDKMKGVDPVIKDAFVWAKEHGITDFNEISLSHEAAVNPWKQRAEDLLSLPMVIPEVVTRPTMFLWYTDMMKGKLSGEELYVAAKRATDYTMTNYHKDEAPLLYQRSGVMGENVGGLKRYSHNAVEQIVSRMGEMKKYPEAFAAAVGFTLLLQGLTGMVGYNVADEISQATTDKPLRHWLEQIVQSPALMDGWLSAMSGMDLNSRFSLAGVVPSNGSAAAEAAVGPHAMKLYGLGKAAIDAVKKQDQQSFNNLARQAIPSGLYGYYEDKNLVNEEGYVLNKEGQTKYEEPRTQDERDFRRHMGIRPLRERIKDEELYVKDKAQKKVDDKRIDAVSRMQAALQLPTAREGDFEAALQAYQDAEGDVRQIEPLLKQWSEKRNQSEQQRRILAPTDRAGSIKKYERYWEK